MSSIELLKKIYNDANLVFDYLHPDFTLHSPGQNLIAGTYYGADGIREHFADMERLSGGSFNHDVHETFLADDNWAMVVHCMEGERNGKRMNMWGFGLFRFKDGLIIDHWESVADQNQWDNFWS